MTALFDFSKDVSVVFENYEKELLRRFLFVEFYFPVCDPNIPSATKFESFFVVTVAELHVRHYLSLENMVDSLEAFLANQENHFAFLTLQVTSFSPVISSQSNSSPAFSFVIFTISCGTVPFSESVFGPALNSLILLINSRELISTYLKADFEYKVNGSIVRSSIRSIDLNTGR